MDEKNGRKKRRKNGENFRPCVGVGLCVEWSTKKMKKKESNNKGKGMGRLVCGCFGEEKK